MERQATSARKPPRLVPRVLDEELAAEQVDPEIPVDVDAEVPLADGDKDCRLRDGVGAEIVQLHSVVLAQGPHELADGDAEAPFVEAHEAYDVALRGLRLRLIRVWGNPRRRPRVGVPRQQPIGDQLLQHRDGGGGLPPWQGLLDVRHLRESRGDGKRKAPKWLSLSLPLSPFSFSLLATGSGSNEGGEGEGETGRRQKAR